MRFIYTKTFTVAFSVFMGIALLFIFDRTGNLGFAKDSFAKAYGGTVNAGKSAVNGVKTFFATIVTIKNLARDNALLNQEINDLAFENARLTAARQENAALRRALNFYEQSTLNLVPVEVKTFDPTGFTKTITIDKGLTSGIAVNDAIVSAPGLLVGKVSRVSENTAEVVLVTDPSIVINAEVSDSGARGIIKGEHGISLTFDLVTQNELIKPGDKVVTSGLSADYPKGLYIGEIAGIRSGASELFQKAYVIPAADLRNIKFLFAVK
jgi:rod shape-determining protein MreC